MAAELILERLGAVWERLAIAQQPPPAREKFQTPEYDGQGDVQLYIHQF